MSKAKVWCWNKTFGIVRKVSWCRQEQVDVTQKKYFMSTKKKMEHKKVFHFISKWSYFERKKSYFFQYSAPQFIATVCSKEYFPVTNQICKKIKQINAYHMSLNFICSSIKLFQRLISLQSGEATKPAT